MLGNANVRGYRAGDRIGYAEYLVRFSGAALAASVSRKNRDLSDTYIIAKRLIYRGQDKISEDEDTGLTPAIVLERPVKQKIRVEKTDDGENIGNFRFKIYLKSNLERIFCTKRRRDFLGR